MAVCRAGAMAKGVSLYQHINDLAGKPKVCMTCLSLVVMVEIYI